MSKILVNTTGSDIFIPDTGVTVPQSPGTYLIDPQNYLLWGGSSDVVIYVGSGDIVVNDGSIDLAPAEGMAHLQGNYPKKWQVADQGEYPIDSVVDGNSVRRWAVDVLINPSNANTFSTIAAPSGTNPVATGPSTLTLDSSDGSIEIEGDSGTDTIDFKINKCRLIISALIFG
jgi:hypothetical protein